VLEVTNFEIVNGCYQARLKDLAGDEIQGTFHSNCKEKIKSNRCRKGSIVVLKDVSSPLDKILSLYVGVCLLYNEQQVLHGYGGQMHRTYLLNDY